MSDAREYIIVAEHGTSCVAVAHKKTTVAGGFQDSLLRFPMHRRRLCRSDL